MKDFWEAFGELNERFGIGNPDFIIYERFKEWIKNQEDFPV